MAATPEAVTRLIDELSRLPGIGPKTASRLAYYMLRAPVEQVQSLGTVILELRDQIVFLTSNNTRELSEALKRRCLYLFLDYPSVEEELKIVRLKVPDLAPELAKQAVELVSQLRSLDLKKAPSVSETLDWARALVKLNAGQLDQDMVENTMTVLLKHEADIVRAKRALGRRGANGGSRKQGWDDFDADDLGAYRFLNRR